MIDPAQFATEHPVLVAAGLYVAEEDLLAWLVAYAEAGGHLILGPRSAIADADACIRTDPKPARLSDAAGVSYQEYANLRATLPIIAETEWISEEAGGVDWMECLTPDGAEVLARPDHPHYKQWAALASNEHGAGRITTVGVIPNAALARDLMAWATDANSVWNLPTTVRRSSAVNPQGHRIHFLFNWSWDEAQVDLPVDLVDVLDGSGLTAGQSVTLGAWGTRILREATPD